MIFKLANSTFLKIVSSAAIADSRVGNGRFIVLLIIDHKNRKDIEDLFNVHSTTKAGEVTVYWARVFFSNNLLLLNIKFVLPIEIEFTVEFAIEEQGILVENIINNKGVYLQLGQPGDRLVNDLNREKILVEIPDTGFKDNWKNLWKKSLVRKYRKKGYTKSEASKIADEIISEIKKFKDLKTM